MKSTKSIGDQGETLACEFIINRGYKIIERNWRNRFCEIDIIAQEQSRIYFIEVKTRKNNTYGDSIDYITAKKLSQMKFAAEMWVQSNKWQGEYQLAAIGITNGKITFIDEL